MLTGDVEGRWAAGVIDTEHARLLWQFCPFAARALVDTAPDLVNTFVHGPSLFERINAHGYEQPDWLVQLREVAERPRDGTVAAMIPQSDLFEQYTRLLQTFAQGSPVLLLIDDLQWADLGSISLLFHLGRHLAGWPIMIVGAYRPEELALGRDGGRHPLEPVVNELQRQFGGNPVGLDEAESRAFVDALVDSEPNDLGPSFRYMVYRQTQGNPLFTIELLRGMQERGDLRPNDSGQWVEGPDLDWESLPARVEAVIAERIARLTPQEQAVLYTASVEGEVFTAEVIARIHDWTLQEVLAALGGELDRKHKLVRAHSIARRDGQTLSSFRFRHILFQKYIYNRLTEVEQVHLHERVGTILEELYGGENGSAAVAPQLARHFEEARVTGKAVHYLREAGKWSLNVSAYQEAVAHLTKGLSLLMVTPPSAERDQQEMALLIAMALALQNTKGPRSADVETVCNRALELNRSSDDALSLSQILGSLATHHFVRAEFQTATEFATQGLSVAEQAGDPLLIALALWYAGLVSFYRGEFVQAREHFSPIITLYDPVQHRDRLVTIRGSDAALAALAYDACCLWVLGYPDQARQSAQDSLAMARDFGHFFTLADCICYAGCKFNDLRRDAEAISLFVEEFFHLMERGGPGSWMEATVYLSGEAHVLSRRPQEGIDQLHRYLDGGEVRGELLNFSGAYRSIAEAYGMMAQVTEGLAAINRGFASIEETGAHIWESEMYRTQAGLFLLQGDEVAAERSLHSAIQVARRQHAKSFELRATVDLARLWQKQGRSEEARQILSEIYGWFTEGFDEPDLVRAGELLEALV
jgi:tetratricopeptide (TPR) repeat protein